MLRRMIKSHFLSMLLPADTTQHTGKNLQQLKTCNSPCKTQPAAAPSNFAGGGGGGCGERYQGFTASKLRPPATLSTPRHAHAQETAHRFPGFIHASPCKASSFLTLVPPPALFYFCLVPDLPLSSGYFSCCRLFLSFTTLPAVTRVTLSVW